MKPNVMLVVTSLLSILLLTLHVTDDIVRGISRAQSSNVALLVLTVFLYGNARARRTAIGARHHAACRIFRRGHACDPHEGGSLRRDRQVQRRLLLRLDTLGAGRAWGHHLHPRGARTVESAAGPPLVI